MNSHEMQFNTNNPEHPVEDIVASLHEREANRAEAIRLGWLQYETAPDEAGQNTALLNIVRMMGVLSEYRALFPEVFPKEEDDK